MKWFKNIIRSVAAIGTAFSLLLGVTIGIAENSLPDFCQVRNGEELNFEIPGINVRKQTTEVTAAAFSSKENSGYQAQVMLFDTIPVKTVEVSVVEETHVIPCGTPFGIKMLTNGVVIVGTTEIMANKKNENPAEKAGLKIGDIITKINGIEVNQNEEVAAIIEKSQGSPLNFEVKRGEETFSTQLQPVKSDVDASWKGGIWVRDSTAGIGTMTFYNPKTGTFGGLGHGICDVDTAELMPLGKGDIVPVTISGIVKGERGKAGELRGYFNSDTPVGTLYANVEAGVYGTLNSVPVNNETMKLAMKQEIKTGPAQILTTIDENGPQYYDIQIESIDYKGQAQSKNMVIRVTDPELLEKTGGIIQGMSGSPIIQDNMLVGAVTHVFVNDPTCGYGIFAENMMEISKNICNQT